MKTKYYVRDFQLKLLGVVLAGSLMSAIRQATRKYGARVYDVSRA